MVDQNKIMSLLEEHFQCKGTVKIDDQGQITVDGNVTLKPTSVIPAEIRFLEVTGQFVCSNNPQLRSLKGAPHSVGLGFYCVDNPQLESLDGLSQTIGASLWITYTKTLPLLRALVPTGGVVFWEGRSQSAGDAVKVAAIINQYRGQGQSAVIICAAELAAAGFKANARW